MGNHSVSPMKISLLGLSYKTTPLEVREKLYISPDAVPGFLNKLRQIVTEGILISTCNRFEILISNNTDTTEALEQLISEHCGLQQGQLKSHLYHYEGIDAVRHIFRVAASLDSMVVGEAQILGQIKHFFCIAQEEKMIGPVLHGLLERTFAVAKKIRSETKMGSNPVSIPSVAVELACKIFGNVEEKTAFVIGAGKMGLLALEHLRSHGVKNIIVTNRTLSKAEELASQIHGRVVPFEDIRGYLREADIVIDSSGSPDMVVLKEHAENAMIQRKNRPMFLIDIAVPRDMDPAIHEMTNVFLYDLDDLQKVSEQNRLERRKEAELAEEMIHLEVEKYWHKLRSLDVNPTIRQIHEKVDQVCKKEVEQTLTRMGSITQEQQQSIEKMVSRLADRILQCPFSELRRLAGQPENHDKIDYIGRLFQL